MPKVHLLKAFDNFCINIYRTIISNVFNKAIWATEYTVDVLELEKHYSHQKWETTVNKIIYTFI